MALAAWACRHDGPRRAYDVPGETGAHLEVEVLNASGVDGLARTGTRVLRQEGLDVVDYGNAPGDLGQLDSTRILVRRGTRAAGERVRRALDVGRVTVQADSTRLVDVSVLLGRDFAARAPVDFHP
jgi:LytR cell envelope-related transcriptional attenuator